jgi:vacuolar protein sorting-associated protein 52
MKRMNEFLDVQQTQPLIELNHQIQSCDDILQNMENLLAGFQVDLAKISLEIETLQEQSQTMNIKLKNRMVCLEFFFWFNVYGILKI